MALFDHYIPGLEDQNQGIFFGVTKQLHNISQQFEATEDLHSVVLLLQYCK